MKYVLAFLLATTGLAAESRAQEQPPDSAPYKMEIPSGLRAWYRNPDG